MVAGRSGRLCRSIANTTCSNAGGTSSRARNAAFTCGAASSINAALFGKITRPLSSSVSTTPIENMSLRGSAGSSRSCSGAMYMILPLTLPTAVSWSRPSNLAMPKSASFTAPPLPIRMFSGLTSRCTSARCLPSGPASVCAWSRARAIGRAISMITAAGSVLPAMRSSPEALMPSTSSKARKGTPLTSPEPIIWTTCGCRSSPPMRHSSRNISVYILSPRNLSRMRLTTHQRGMSPRSSIARWISAMPPVPIGPSNR